jgi:hypothetical protein
MLIVGLAFDLKGGGGTCAYTVVFNKDQLGLNHYVNVPQMPVIISHY